MDFKEDGTITIDKVKKKKVKCYKFHCKPLDRFLMVHEDLENKEHTTISDFSTGYKLFKVQTKPNKITPEELKDKLEKYINHFTVEGIQEEINRLQNQELELVKERSNSNKCHTKN